MRENFKLGGISLKLDLVGKTKIAADERLAQKNVKIGKVKTEKPKRAKKPVDKKKTDPRKKHSLKKLIAKKEAMRQKIKALRKKK